MLSLIFFQRIKDGSLIDSIKTICVGDHIESINGEDIIGWRHYDVAKKLKELKKDEPFTLKLIEPKKAFGKFGCVYVCEVFPSLACLSKGSEHWDVVPCNLVYPLRI